MRVDDEGRNIAIAWKVEGRKTPKKGKVVKTAHIEVNNKYETLHFEPDVPEIPDFEEPEQAQSGRWGDEEHDKVMIGPRRANTKEQEEGAMNAKTMFSMLKEVATVLKEEECEVVSNDAEKAMLTKKKKWITKGKTNMCILEQHVCATPVGRIQRQVETPEQNVCAATAGRVQRQGADMNDK